MRLLHTVRYLRPVQVWGRVWFHLYRPRPDARPASAPAQPARLWRACARTASMTGPASFRFLGVERNLTDAVDWNRSDWPRLWLYNLHYFDDLVADAAAQRHAWHRTLIARWIAENPPATGNGWDPYPVSLRIVNWIKWALAGNALDVGARHSLAIQTRWLHRRLEVHLQGNHLWANIKALLFAGAFFSGAEAARWRRQGLRRCRAELSRQILADGGHVERSPMYHAIVLEDLLDLIQLAVVFPALVDAEDLARWHEIAMRMLHWLRVMSHPDGGIALFNDAALGIAPDYAALRRYATALGLAVDDAAPLADLEALPDSGYVRMQAGAAILIADVGEIGPDYQPGHAHADTLSFELSLHGMRLLVNSGTSTYEADAERVRQRGTAAHNTVSVDATDSSEIWSSFRVARRARPRDVSYGRDGDSLRLRAGHDGYTRLPGRPEHRREWDLSRGRLVVRDRVSGSFAHAESRLRIHPDWQVRMTDSAAGEMHRTRSGNGAVLRVHWRATPSASVREATYHPGFGVDLACPLIEIPVGRDASTFTLEWQ